MRGSEDTQKRGQEADAGRSIRCGHDPKSSFSLTFLAPIIARQDVPFCTRRRLEKESLFTCSKGMPVGGGGRAVPCAFDRYRIVGKRRRKYMPFYVNFLSGYALLLFSLMN